MERQIRRKDRAIDETSALQILKNAEYGILSTADAQGQPYGLPMSFAVMGNEIYTHCALEGHKLDNIRANPRVSFCAVGRTEVLPGKFSTLYESAVVFGIATVLEGGEKQKPLEAILEKYSPEYKEKGLEYINNSSHKLVVIKISIDRITGKARKA